MSSCNGNQHPTGRASSEDLSSVDSSLSLKTCEVADALLSLKNNDADSDQNFKVFESKKQKKKRKLQKNKMRKDMNGKGNSDPLKSGDETIYKFLLSEKFSVEFDGDNDNDMEFESS